MRTTIHPHNDALLVIDAKIDRLRKTFEHIQSLNPNTKMQVATQREFDEIRTRMNHLNASKKFLLSAGEMTPVDYECDMERVMSYVYDNPHGSRGAKRVILQYDLNGELIKEFESIKVASEQTGIRRQSIIANAKGRTRKTHNGFIFKYKLI